MKFTLLEPTLQWNETNIVISVSGDPIKRCVPFKAISQLTSRSIGLPKMVKLTNLIN